MTAPIERFKDAYKNWRYNPFTPASMAVDKEEDHLFIPGGAPFHIQLLEVPRKDEPTATTVYCYDDVANFTEVLVAPAQGEFRVDYPPEDGEGTGLIEFNQNDTGKEVKINYKATGSPALAEYLDTKVSYPAGSPATHQILGFVGGAPDWRYNPVCYFHDDNVIYHSSGEDESCLLFRFKRSTKQATVLLELKGAKLHQGFYTELSAHVHGVGTLAVVSAGAHTHAPGTLVVSTAPNHSHAKGTLAGSQPTHLHAKGTIVAGNTNLAHDHTIGVDAVGNHSHGSGGYGFANHDHYGVATGSGYTAGRSGDVTGTSGTSGGHGHSADSSTELGNHDHTITGSTALGGGDAVTIAGNTASAGSHLHTLSGATASAGAHVHSLSGSTASTGTTPKTYPDNLKVYINSVDKTAQVLALTALTEFGDGSAGHDFVTTGSGEMDVSALFAAAQIHEIKITEPTAAKGGRCLLHLEVY